MTGLEQKQKFSQDRTTLMYGAKLYLVYLRARQLQPEVFAAQVRVLRHILTFYGYGFRLRKMTGSSVLRYANIYDPWNKDERIKERARYFWHFVHWLKKNEMIPGFTDQEP